MERGSGEVEGTSLRRKIRSVAPYLDRPPFRLRVKNGETERTKSHGTRNTAEGFAVEKRRKERGKEKRRSG